MTTYEPGLGEALADRIEIERTSRGWSYGALSKELSRIQCKIAPSSLHRIERGIPPRPISAEELFAFAEVFGVDVTQLAQPASEHFRTKAFTLLERHALNAEAMVDLRQADAFTTAELLDACRHLPDDTLEDVVNSWIEHAELVRGSFEDVPTLASKLISFLKQQPNATTPFVDAIGGDALRVPAYRYWSDPDYPDEPGTRLQRPPAEREG
ncbi:helix-turn-helix domain-containing protein [Demequina aurantiaca]|uniref:helix-turn-helix domain-containing protein n=1 Tax=Demequina aurantiaca TaxID=676200 RepID=UPI003D33020F